MLKDFIIKKTLSVVVSFVITKRKIDSMFPCFCAVIIRDFKKSTTATATGKSLNKRFNEQNNSYVRAL